MTSLTVRSVRDGTPLGKIKLDGSVVTFTSSTAEDLFTSFKAKIRGTDQNRFKYLAAKGWSNGYVEIVLPEETNV